MSFISLKHKSIYKYIYIRIVFLYLHEIYADNTTMLILMFLQIKCQVTFKSN